YCSSELKVAGDKLASVISQAGVWKIGSPASGVVALGRWSMMVCTSVSVRLGKVSSRADSTARGAVFTLIRAAGMSASLLVVSLSSRMGNNCGSVPGAFKGGGLGY